MKRSVKKIIKKPEILAPAGSPEAVLAALRCGANAVYVGAGYSARNDSADFTFSQLQQAADLCHLYHAKLHLAVNTLLTDREFPEFETFLKNAVQCGIDACIVQDLGILSYIHETVPDLPLHASTQMSIHTPQGALQARNLGCSRIVLARELSCGQIREIAELPIETEVFVHGALCMSVSGQCSFSAIAGGRSANRGQCAQACRLPWRTPSGDNPAALSLKDLTLVEHVKTLQEMGVDSFKIEGRLKRPEYVAAAVTAFQMALDGKQPDLKLLESVFSRNGFTDGYFTGRKQEIKKDMFGFRRKEDVLAGQQVFSAIRETYRNPPKIANLDFDLQLQAGKPAVLHVSDQDGNQVSVCGKIPEIAQNQPLRSETAEKYFRKLGNTIYEFHHMKFQNPDGLTLSASDCNAMRRDAVEQCNQLRQKKEIYQILENLENSENPENFKNSEKSRIPRKRVHVRTMKQFQAIQELKSKSECILCVPIDLAEKISEQDVTVWLEAPRIIQNEKNYQDRLELLFAKGFRDLLCHNLTDIRIGQKIGYHLHGGFGLHCTNSRTADSLIGQGLQDVTLSYELRSGTIQELCRKIPCDCGAYLYGRIPMMLLRICPIRAQEGKCRHHKNCVLTDRTGRKFPLYCNPNYLELLNAEVLFLGDKLQYFKNLSYWDLYFTDETPEQLREIWQSYYNNFKNMKNYTRGLYFKGGLC